MKEPVCIALIKFSQREVDLMVNALENLIRFEVAFSDSDDWKKPYEKIMNDLKRIRREMDDKIESSMETRDQTSSVVQDSVCEE